MQAFIGLVGRRAAGPTFETLPWDDRATPAGSVLLVKQPEADAVLAVLRGEAPIPTTTTAPADGGSGSGTSAPAAVRPSDVRVKVLNGSGVQGAAGNTVAGAAANSGFVPGGTGNDTARHRRPERDPLRAGRRGQGPARGRRRCPARSWSPDSSLPGTDVVLVLGQELPGRWRSADADHRRARGDHDRRSSPEAACQ